MMPRCRPSTNPISFHKKTGQFYITRGGRRFYLGSDREAAMEKYFRINLGYTLPDPTVRITPITLKELANRFLTTQQANWKNPQVTLQFYRNTLKRFLNDHRGLFAHEFTVEMYAQWKMYLKRQEYQTKSINHYLSAVRALFRFADETELLERIPRLQRVKNETDYSARKEKPIYTQKEIGKLLLHADIQLQAMILLGLNCGFGPQDIHDLKWEFINGQHVTLARSKTGISQTFRLWPETVEVLNSLLVVRTERLDHAKEKEVFRSDNGYVFITYFWKPWTKDALARQFRRLCKKANISCYGFYRLRHSASTAISSISMPHVQRKFLRHAKLQQQVTYTHVPDSEVDKAVMKVRKKILPRKATSNQERNP